MGAGTVPETGNCWLLWRLVVALDKKNKRNPVIEE
jgi:hypothetical protein